MSAPTTIQYKPTSTITGTGSTTYAFLPRLKSSENFSSLHFPSTKSLFSGKVVSQKPVSLCRRARSPNTMSVSTGISALGDSIGDKGAGAFEQESFIEGSSDSEFCRTYRAVGLESALNGMSKWLMIALFCAVLLWRHDAEAVWAGMGAVINTGLSTILKQVLNQERPLSTLRSDPGMPSSHAQSFFFSIIFVIVSMFQWLGVNGVTITLSGLTLAFGSYLSFLRVSQKLHTISQVVVGAVLGSVFSILWFWSWNAIVLKAFISYLWVRIVVVLVGTGFCLGYLIYVFQNWVIVDQ